MNIKQQENVDLTYKNEIKSVLLTPKRMGYDKTKYSAVVVETNVDSKIPACLFCLPSFRWSLDSC